MVSYGVKVYNTNRVNPQTLYQRECLKKDLWLARISSLSSKVGLYVVVYSPDKDSVCSKRGTTEIL
jgi:hypothetical protein